jgi:hypothetical protein
MNDGIICQLVFYFNEKMLQLETWTFDIVLLQQSKWIGILKVWKVSGKCEILLLLNIV